MFILIGPGEVKVDLANFDLKLQENLLSTLYIRRIKIENSLLNKVIVESWGEGPI
jgi:hypothetical protein